MSTMRFLMLACWLAMAFFSGCASAPEKTVDTHGIRSVAILVLPDDRGRAFCDFAVDGMTQGGHMSGEPLPFVHQDNVQLRPEVIEAIWQAAGDVLDAGLLAEGGARGERGFNAISLVMDDGRNFSVSWPFRQQPEDPRLRRLADLVFEHRIGGW